MTRSDNFFSEVKNVIKSLGFSYILLLIAMYTIMLPMHVYIKDAVCIIIIILYFKGWSDRIFGRISLFCISYALTGLLLGCIGSYFELLAYILGPLAFYLVGKRIVSELSTSEEAITAIIILFCASSISLWINNITDAQEMGLVNVTRVITIQGNEMGLSATVQGLIASICISLAAYIFSTGGFNGVKSVICLILATLSVFCVIHLVNRTGLVVLMATILATILYSSRANFKNLFFAAIALIIFYFLLTKYGVINEDMFAAYETRQLQEERGTIEAGGRTEIWVESLKLIFMHPFGWYGDTILGHAFCHNMWLDVARCTGWLPFLLLLSISMKQMKKLYSLCLIPNDRFIAFLVGVTCCFFLSAFVEPVIEASSSYFALISLLWGVQNAYQERIESI